MINSKLVYSHICSKNLTQSSIERMYYIMEQNYYIINPYTKFIEIRGKDRNNFLQGLITNDINKCHKNEQPIYSCFLSPQGKFLADFFIININNYFLI